MTYNPTGMCNYAQGGSSLNPAFCEIYILIDECIGLFAAYTMAYPELLDSREELHAALLHREECVRADNYDPLLHSGSVLLHLGFHDTYNSFKVTGWWGTSASASAHSLRIY